MAKKLDPNETSPAHEDIARRAYELWERDGRPEGRALDHWQQAEAMLRESMQPGPAARSSRKPAPARANSRREKEFEVIS